MSAPFLAIFLSHLNTLTETQISLIISSQPFANLFFLPCALSISRRFSLKRILVFVPFLWAINSCLFVLANEFYLFILLNGINGIFSVVYESNCKRALSNSSMVGHRFSIYQFRYGLINLGAAIGPALSTLTEANEIKNYLILGGAYFMVACGNCFLTLPSDSIANNQIEQPQPKEPLYNQRALFLLILGISFSYIAYSQLNSTIPQYLNYLTKDSLTVYRKLLSYSSILILFGQFPLLFFTKKYSSKVLLIVSNCCFASCLFVVPYLTKSSFLVFFVIIYVVGEILLGANFDYSIDQLASEQHKGRYFTFAEMVKAGAIAGPIIGAQLIQLFTWQKSNLIFISLGIITLTGSLILFNLENS